MTWHLFVDESGDFNRDAAHVLVTGLAVREPRDGSEALALSLKSVVNAVFPDVVYPPHATVLRSPSGLVASVALGKPDEELPLWVRAAAPVVRERVDDLTRLLRKSDGNDAKYERDSTDAWLRQHRRGCHDALRREIEIRWNRHRGLGRALRSLELQPFIVAAVETHPESRKNWHLYLLCLAALFERAHQLLVPPAGTTKHLHLHVAIRDVQPNQPLTAVHVRQAWGMAVNWAPNDPRFGGLDLASDPEVSNYDRHVPAGIVLADLFSNGLIAPTDTEPSIERIERRTQGSWQIPVTRVPAWAPERRVLPALAARGNPSMAVRNAFRGMPPGLETRLHPRWTVSQAKSWIAAAGEP